MSGSALKGGAVFEGEGQAAIRVKGIHTQNLILLRLERKDHRGLYTPRKSTLRLFRLIL
jgi:hypothetical protein